MLIIDPPGRAVTARTAEAGSVVLLSRVVADSRDLTRRHRAGTDDAVVYLVRHGRTALNAAGALRGRLDPLLDNVGEVEAAALGEAFRGVDIAAVVTSPLRRARQTAAAIAMTTGVLLEIDERLIDRDYGPWAGSSHAEVVRQCGSIDAAPGVESRDEVASRATAAVLDWVEKSAPGAMIAVAHDAVNRAVLGCLIPALGHPDTIVQHTGCWNRLERRARRWSAPIIDAIPGTTGAAKP